MTFIAVTGSIATDHLMRFPGRFAEQLVAEQLAAVSLSFLVDDLTIRRGGVAANIAYGLSQLGLRPSLVGAAGRDFADYRAWLESQGIDCGSVHASETAYTARFVCTTDLDECQIASFYPGAMAEARAIDLGALAVARGAPDLVVVGPDDPAAMLRHARFCRAEGWAYAADPSQQLARLSGPQILEFITGAHYLMVNGYEWDLLRQKTSQTTEQLLARVHTVITTQGAQGVRVVRHREQPIVVPACPVDAVADPTGGGDAFRAGFLAAMTWQLPVPAAVTVGCVLAAQALATVGTQEYRIDRRAILHSLERTYGQATASAVDACWPRPAGPGAPVAALADRS